MVSIQRRLNSTGRVRISRERVQLALEEPADAISFPWFSATINLGDLDLPGNAKIAIEAYYRSSSMRFACGSVAEPRVADRMELSDIDRGGAIQFRVLVFSPESTGQILASAEGLRPARKGDGPDREPLLPLRETDLGEELWKVEVDFRNGPMLLLNSGIPGFASRLRSSALLQGLILPHALRQILQTLPDVGEDEGGEAWSDKWRTFLRTLGAPDEPDDSEDEQAYQVWIDDSAKLFCDLKGFTEKVRSSTSAAEYSYV
jgi:hypothetical protein